MHFSPAGKLHWFTLRSAHLYQDGGQVLAVLRVALTAVEFGVNLRMIPHMVGSSSVNFSRDALFANCLFAMPLRVAFLRVASLRVCSFRDAFLHVASLRYASLRVSF